MANLNRIILVGRLATDPEVRATLDGIPMTRFKLSVNRPTGGSDLMDIIAWRRLAEICGEFLKKGQLVLIEGRIQVRSFEDQTGIRRWATEIIARNMQMLEKSPIANRQSSPIETKALITEPEEDIGLESDLPF